MFLHRKCSSCPDWFSADDRLMKLIMFKFPFVTAVNIGTNPGLAAIWEDEQQRRRDANESSQISAPSSQGQNNNWLSKINFNTQFIIVCGGKILCFSWNKLRWLLSL